MVSKYTLLPFKVDLFCCILCGCKVIHAGEKLRESKKKQKMASSNSTTNRDWGKVSECIFNWNFRISWNKAKLFTLCRK